MREQITLSTRSFALISGFRTRCLCESLADGGGSLVTACQRASL